MIWILCGFVAGLAVAGSVGWVFLMLADQQRFFETRRLMAELEKEKKLRLGK